MLMPRLFVVLALVLLCGPAAAQAVARDRRGAAEAYDKGTAAYLAGDYAQAGGWFETAHRLSPAPAALQQSIRAYRRAQENARAATLSLELSRDYADNRQARELAEEVLEEARGALVQVEVSCTGCSVALDGKVQASHSFFVEPGTTHDLNGSFDSGDVQQVLEAGDAGNQLSVRMAAPPEPRGPEPDEGSERTPLLLAGGAAPDFTGLSPRVAFIGAGVTGVLVVSTLISGIGASSRGDSYETAANEWNAAGCASMADSSETCDRLYRKADARLDTAESSELRTNLLLGGTLVAGAATAIIAAFFTDWDDEKSPEVSLEGGPRGDLLGRLRMKF